MKNLFRFLELFATVFVAFLSVLCPVSGEITPAIAVETLVRISGQNPSYFGSIQSAYDNAQQWDEIQAQAVNFNEHLLFDKGNTITLHGGYDPGFVTDTGLSVVRGDLSISTGTVIVKNIAIAPEIVEPTTGANVYAIEIGGNLPHSVYTFDTRTPNDLTLLGLNTIPFYNYALGFDASGNTLYAMDTINRLGIIDKSTGNYTLIGSVFGILWYHNVFGLATDPTTGVIYILSTDGFAGSSALYSLNLITLNATLIGTQTIVKNLVELASDLAGNIYTISLDTDSLYKFNKLNGQVILVGALDQDIIGQQGMAFDQSTGILYGIIGNRDLGNYSFGTINTTTGSFTASATTSGVRKIAIPLPPPVNESKSIPLGIPTVGQVATRGESRYYTSGLTPGSTHTVSINNLSNAADLHVFSDGTYSFELDCTLRTPSNSCTLQTSDTLYFSVEAGPLNRDGARFVILVL